LLGFAESFEKWFAALEETLRLASERNIKFNLKKCDLFTRRVKFCGRIFSPDGVGHDPDRIEALLAIPQPQTARDLQQFLMASQWMSRSIPEYNKKVHLLQDVFEKCMKDQPSRNKSVARQVKLSRFGWNPGHALAFEELKTAVARCVKLAYPREDMIQCVFTDANETCTSGMVTQIPFEDEDKPAHLQRHEPLGFVGHRFNRCEMNWTVAEKEGFAIKDTVQKLDYLLQMKRPFKLFSDHKNLIQIFSPRNVSKPTAQKLQRWALFMQRFRYTIEHIMGEDNVWADLMTRWGANPDSMTDAQILVRRVSPVKIPADARVRPLQNPEFVWPNIEEINKTQKQFLVTVKTLKRNEDNLAITDSGKVIIPEEAEDLRRRLCIIAHAGGNSGHLGYQATAQKLAQFFYWKNSVEDAKAVCSSCLHCLPTRGGARVPRPLGTQVHGSRPNEVVHMDWIYIWPMKKNGIHEYQWNLIIRDDLSGMIKMTPAKQPETSVTVEALMEWRAQFGTPEILVSDMASYFVSMMMNEFASRCNMRQHITTAYGHYNNGSIEVINKIYLALIRALLSELRWDKEYWPWLNRNVEHTINHRGQSRLNGYAPITVMTGLLPDNPLEEIFRRPGSAEFFRNCATHAQIQKHVQELRTALDNMHKAVSATSAKQRTLKKQHKQYRRVPNFGTGDYVLVGVPEPAKMTGRKLFLKWHGPYQITDTKENYVFEVENIIDHKRRWVHGDRIRLYSDDKLDITEEIKRQFAHDNESYQVEKFHACRLNPENHQLELLVEWKGFTEDDNSWEPLKNLYEDVPELVKNFQKKMREEKTAYAEEIEDYTRGLSQSS